MDFTKKSHAAKSANQVVEPESGRTIEAQMINLVIRVVDRSLAANHANPACRHGLQATRPAGRVVGALANMRASASLAVVFLLFATSCSPPSPPTGSTFLAGFNPAATLSKVGGPDGITYSGGSSSESASKEVFSGVRINKSWGFGFQGSDAQLLAQLDRLRAEVESQLSSSGCSIGARGNWSGDFSGFGFEYGSGGTKGFLRVTGVSFESGRQGLDIFVYEQ